MSVSLEQSSEVVLDQDKTVHEQFKYRVKWRGNLICELKVLVVNRHQI
jgi:hypothetical protein